MASTNDAYHAVNIMRNLRIPPVRRLHPYRFAPTSLSYFKGKSDARGACPLNPRRQGPRFKSWWVHQILLRKICVEDKPFCYPGNWLKTAISVWDDCSEPFMSVPRFNDRSFIMTKNTGTRIRT